MYWRRSALVIGTAAATVLTALTAAVPVSAHTKGTTRYVSVTGSDANRGTKQSPFSTVQQCADVAQAGDTCVIAAGTYRETLTPPREASCPFDHWNL